MAIEIVSCPIEVVIFHCFPIENCDFSKVSPLKMVIFHSFPIENAGSSIVFPLEMLDLL